MKEENTRGKKHRSLDLLAGNRQSGCRAPMESIQRPRAVVTNADSGGSNHLLHELLQGELAVLCSGHRLVKLGGVQIPKALETVSPPSGMSA